MKNTNRFAAFVVAAALLGGAGFGYAHFSKMAHPSPHESVKIEADEEENKLEMSMELWEQEFEKIKDPATNTVPLERLEEAYRYSLRPEAQRFGRASLNLKWSERGPNNIGGRTRALLFDASVTTNKKVWAGGVGGGLWYTNDITATSPVWKKINDFFGNIAITSIAQDPSNAKIMYFGTGEGFGNLDAQRGIGIWKSIDGGLTWAQISSTNNSTFHYIQRVVVDKLGIVYAATQSGIQKSTNYGVSWTKVLGTGLTVASSSNNFADIEIAADGSIYAACRAQVWKSSRTTYGSATGNLGNWTNITPVGAVTWQRLELACAPSNSSRVYVLAQGSGNDCDAIYHSENGGTAWTFHTPPTIIDQGSNSNFTRGQCWYDLMAAVDPNNADVLYIGGVDVLRSTDKGTTWGQISTWSSFAAPAAMPNVHADIHYLAFAKGSSTRAIIGCDGGVYYSNNISTAPYPTFAAKNSGYNVTQYYAADIHPTAGMNYILAGAQDNGTQKITGVGISGSTQASGGDGAFCHINQKDANYQVSSYVYSSFYISTNGGVNFSNVNMNGVVAKRGNFINPSDYDDDANILYFGDEIGTLGSMSSIGVSNTYTAISYSAIQNSKLSAIKVDPNTLNRVYVAASSKIIRIDNANGAAIATNVTGNYAGTGSISSIDVQTGNANHLLVTSSNYGVNSVYESTDGGTTWVSVEGNLPDMPVRWGIFNPKNGDQVMLATELGVWSTDNLNGAATQWFVDNIGLGNARVDMLKYRTSDYTLVAGTHGRGAWTATIPGIYVAPVAPTDGQNLDAFAGTQAVPRFGVKNPSNTGGGVLNWNFNVLNNPFTEQLHVALTEEITKKYTVRLIDFSGRKVLEQSFGSESNRQFSLNTGGLSSGNYILTIEVAGEKPRSQKVFKL